jgi:hypothetical protein
MLERLENAYGRLADQTHATPEERNRLSSVVDDLRWYAARLGAERWQVAPRAGRWSFAENLWHVTEQAQSEAASGTRLTCIYFIDHGKEHVGQAAEIFALFEYS